MTSKLKAFLFKCTCFTLAVLASRTDFEITSFDGISFSECFGNCLKRPSCRSIRFKRRATYCKLYNETMEDKISWRENPGTVVRDSEHLSHLSEEVKCPDRICILGEECDGTCKISECPMPPSIPDARRRGNRRHIGAKVVYRCQTFRSWRVYSRCQENGEWSPVVLTCKTPGYKFYGTGVYMRTSRFQDSFAQHSISLEDCLLKCNQSTEFCVGINFFPENRTCVSTSWKPLRGGSPAPVDEPGWYLFTKTLPVFHVSYGNPYDFTYKDATPVCESFNSTFASITDVNSAFLLGFSLCSCAWVIEGYSVIAIKYDNPRCFGKGNGVYKCWTADKFHVFCKDQDFFL